MSARPVLFLEASIACYLLTDRAWAALKLRSWGLGVDMTHLFGCICNQPAQLALSLTPIRNILATSAPIARWGYGYVQAGEVLRSRNPRSQNQAVDFSAIIDQLHSDYIIGHACGPDSLSGNANTQPLRYRKWMLAQENQEPDNDDERRALRTALTSEMPAFLARAIAGHTLAELYFHTFLAQLHQASAIDDAHLPAQRTVVLARRAADLVGTAIEKTGTSGKLGNVVISNGRSFSALRLAGPLYMRRLSIAEPKGSDEESFRGTLIVSADTVPDGAGFEEIPRHSAVLANRDLQVDIVALDKL